MDSVRVIDSLEFARSGGKLHGRVAVAHLERLADALFDSEGGLEFEVSGAHDFRQRPRLEVSVKGEVNLRCQRCMGRLAFPVAIKSSLLVLVEQAGVEAAELGDLDGIPADAHADVWALVEDEILLAIPYAPRHPEGGCTAAVDLSADRDASPFAALAKLRQDQN